MQSHGVLHISSIVAQNFISVRLNIFGNFGIYNFIHIWIADPRQSCLENSVARTVAPCMSLFFIMFYDVLWWIRDDLSRQKYLQSNNKSSLLSLFPTVRCHLNWSQILTSLWISTFAQYWNSTISSFFHHHRYNLHCSINITLTR